MGTGYTRQSAADIVTGANITAAPLNAEFNAIQSAFNSSTGHSHDGTSGEGPLIDLTAAITGVLPVANGGISAKHKIDATAAPGTSDDSSSGYGPGSIWIDVTNDKAYVCVDATVANAVWFQISTSSYIAAIGALTPTDGNMIVGNGTTWVAESGATLRTSIGVGTGDTPQFTGIELGNATDTTISRVSAGVIAVEGSNVLLASNIGSSVQGYDAELAAIAGLTSAADKLPYFTGSGTAGLADFTTFGRSLVDDASASAARTTLGLVIGTDVQAQDAELSAIAGLTSAADSLPYFTGSGTAALTTLTTTARSLLDDASTSAMRTTLGLAIGTDVQAYDAGLASIAGLTTASDKMIYTTALDTYAVTDLTSTARSLLDDTSTSAMRTTLGLAIGTDVQAYDVDTLKADVADTLTAGFRDSLDDDGTQSSGTYTPSDSAGTWSKKIINNGAFTFGPPSPSNDEVIYGTVLVVNGASAGAVTVTGWTATGGASLTTTNGHKFIGTFVVFDVAGTEYSYLSWTALQ